MAFPPQFLDEIRTRLSLSEVIGRRVKLARKGREHLGLCPFHNEKTPSFTVNDAKGFYHCFGCGAHGDVIRFVTDTEGLNFPEAVERLAGLAGLEVPRATPEEQERYDLRERLMAINEAACKWFEARLRGEEGKAARDYLRGRGLTQETIATFRLGFAPDSRGRLSQDLSGHGPEHLETLGLVKRPDDGRQPFDFFRGRVIFPILDRRGRPIAYGGRLLGPGEPKYLNTPETILFHKGETLFGLATAREAAQASGEVIVTEGYMDVIALHQAGIRHAVAPLGTALTEGQLAALWRLAPLATLCFDGDNAGKRAARRAMERALPLLAASRAARFAEMPAGEDPDSLVRDNGTQAFRDVLDTAAPLADVLWDGLVTERPLHLPEQRAALRNDFKETLGKIADQEVAREYRDQLNKRYMLEFGAELFPSGGRSKGDDGNYVQGYRDGHRDGQARLLVGDFRSGYQLGFEDGRNRASRLRAHLETIAARTDRQGQQAFHAGYTLGFEDASKRKGYQLNARLEQRASRTRGAAPSAALPGPAEILLAAALNHPWKAAVDLDTFGTLEMPGESHRALHTAMVEALARDPELDSPGLRRHLSSLGLDKCVEAAVPRSLFVHAGFAGPDAAPETVEAGWSEMLTALARHRARRELAEETERLAEDLDEARWGRLADRRSRVEDDLGAEGAS